jgi:hypothetical protein
MENAVAGTPVDAKHSELVNAEGHICAFFHSVDEEYKVLMPVVREGFERGERIFYIVDPDLRADHLSRMSAGGIDVVGGEASGQLVMLDWSQTYLSTGRLDQERFASQFASVRADSSARGFPRTRCVSHMEWGLRGNLDQIAAWEVRANFVPLKPDVGICTYQLEHWGGRMLVNALRSHPLVILGGLLHENPFYVPPTPLARPG